MACKYIFNGVEYKDKQAFIEEFVKPNFINQPKTLRVQEYQSDYFQKLRNNFKFRGVPHNIIIPADNNGKKVYLIDEVEVSSNVYNKAFEDFIDAGGDNQFLALLHKNDNWITFGIKAIIQNAAKQGYEKVLFPTGNTASKVEGHSTLEDFKKQKEDRIAELEKEKLEAKDKIVYYVEDVFGNRKFDWSFDTKEDAENANNNDINYLVQETKLQPRQSIDTEINQLKEELDRVNGPEGFGALKPIFNFYENTVTNILKKQGYNPVLITDEYGNTWNEININEVKSKVQEIDLLPTVEEKTKEQISLETLDLSTIPLFSDKISAEQQTETINWVTANVVYQLNQFEVKNVAESIDEYLNNIKELLINYDTEETNLILDVWKDFADVAKFNILGTNIDFESHEKINVEDEKEGSYEEGRALRENPYLKIGQELKKQLFAIPEVVNITEDGELEFEPNWFGGEKYISIDEVLPTVLSYLQNQPADFDVMVNHLENNVNAHKWFQAVSNLLQGSTEQTKIQFARWANKHVVNLKYLLYDNTEKTFNYNNSNSGRKQDIILEQWVENIKSNGLFTIQDGVYSLNRAKADEILHEYTKIINDFTVNKNEDELLDRLLYVLNSIGVDINKDELMSMQEHLNIQGTKWGKKTVNFKDIFLTNNSPLYYSVNRMKESDKNKETFDKNNPLSDNSSIKFIAGLYSQFKSVNQNDSYKGIEGNTYYAFSQNKFATDRFQKLLDKSFVKNLLETQFASTSTWGKVLSSDDEYQRNLFLDNFSVDYLDGSKEDKSKKAGKAFDQLTSPEQEFFRWGIFQNQARTADKEGKIRVGVNSFLTMSDKATLLTVQSVLENFTYDFENDTITDETADKLLFIVEAEFKRIVAFENLTESEKDKLPEQFRQGSNKFIVSNYINDYKELLNEDGKIDTDKTKQLIKEYYNRKIQETKQRWVKNKIIDASKKGEDQFWVDTRYLKFIKSKVLDDKNLNQLYTYAAMDYELNNHVSNFNLFQLFAGDPASYYSKTIYDTLVNVGKRLAAQIAPGSNLGNTSKKDIAGINGHNYIQIFSQDQNLVSSQIKYLTKLLDNKQITDAEIEILKTGKKEDKQVIYSKYPQASDYMKIESTDAQEYMTALEAVYNLFHEGKLNDDDYKSLVNKLINDKELSEYEIKLILNPQKPVYYGQEVKSIRSEGGYKYNDITYIKSSAFPLLKHLTQGSELDKLRIQMEKIQNPNNSKNPEDIQLVRLAFKTATKIGSMQNIPSIFDNDGNIVDVDFSDTQKILNRENFRIQQEVPFKEYDKVNRGTQEIKLLFGDILDIKFDGINGYELRQEFINYNKELFQKQLEVLKNRLGVENNNFKFENLKELLLDEAKKRNYNHNEIEALNTIDEQSFVIPLMFNPSANKFESLLLSLIDNNVRKQKMSGYASPLGSSAGFKWGSLNDVAKSDIISVGDWDPSKGLLPQRIEDGVVKGAQILAPFKFVDNKGKLLNIEDFIIKKDGKKLINHNLLPKELLQSMGFRIPTQGLNSMSYIEIVGFLPDAMGDLLIAPAEFTKQMGSDFDIDKLYGYLYKTIYNKNSGKLKIFRLTESEKENIINKHLTKKLSKVEKDVDYDKLLVSLFGEDLVNEALKEEFEEWQEKEDKNFNNYLNNLIIKDLQNKILDTHFKVLTHPQVQKNILKALGFGNLQDLKKLYDGNSAKNLDVLSTGYQIEKYIGARTGKAGTGYFSTLLTFNSVIQGLGLRFINKEDKSNPELKLVIDSSGTGLSSNKDNKGNFKSQNIVATQSASVDDEKEQILASLNINTNTLYAIGAFELDGHTDTDIVGLINLPIIKEYVSDLVIEQNQFTSTTKVSEFEIFNNLFNIYKSKGNLTDEDSNIEILENKGYTFQEMFNATFLPEEQRTKDWYIMQLSALAKFIKADTYGKSIQRVINSFGVDSKGLGKSFLQAEITKRNIQKEIDFPKLLNINNLKNSIGYSSYEAALIPATELFNNQFQYLTTYNTDVFDKILKYTLQNDLTLEQEEFLFRDIHNNMKSAIYADMISSLSQENLNDLRTRLMFGEQSLAKRVKQIKENTSNPFLIKLRYKISPDTNLPDEVSMRSVGGELFTDNDVYAGFLDLFSKKETRDLVFDLIDYFYVNGGVQQAREYSKYIPIGFLVANGNAKYLRGVDIHNFTQQLGTPDEFIHSYIRNNPYKAPQVPEGIKITDNSFEVNYENGLFYLEGEKLLHIPYLQKYVKGEGTKLYMHIDNGVYSEIPSLGSKFNYEYKTNKSVYPENKVEIKSPVVEVTNIKESVEPVVENTEYVSQDFKSLGIKKNNNSKDVVNILNKINSETAKTIAAIIENQKIDLSLSIGDENSFIPESNKITINKSISSQSKLITTIIHEATHGITSNIINKILEDPNKPNFDGLTESQKLSYLRLDKVLKAFETKIAEGKLPGLTSEGLQQFRKKVADYKAGRKIDFNSNEVALYNKFLNLKEFLAEAFSNKDFQTELNNLEYKKNKTFLQELIEAITNFINKFKGVNPNSVLAQVLYDGFNLAGGIKTETKIENNPNDISTYINHSGGAIGSDSQWDIIGKEFGMINNKHYYHGNKTPKGNTPITEDQLNEGIQQVKKTYAVLGRPEVPKYYSLHGRNWYQVKNSDAVFAISNILKPGEKDKKGYLTKSIKNVVEGGTGYAVEMAIQNNIPVYVYNQGTSGSFEKGWYKWGNDNFVKINTPILTPNFAGIGTREINDDGKQAIRNVYENTVNYLASDQQSFQSSSNIEVVSLSSNFTRESVRKDNEYLYLFTDNANRTSGNNLVDPNSWYAKIYGINKKYPTMTQAVIRGLNNAFPITTMVDDKRTQWKDSQFEEYKNIIDDEINNIKKELVNYKGIKFAGQMPFGKGQISDMKNSAPKIWNYLNTKLLEIGIDNTGEKPISFQENVTDLTEDTVESSQESLKLFNPNNKELKKGSVVEYKNEKYLFWNNNNGKAQLIKTDGTKFSGTPNIDKLTVLGSYQTTMYNNTEYIVTDNNNVYSGATGNLVYTGNDNSSKTQKQNIINKAKENLQSKDFSLPLSNDLGMSIQEYLSLLPKENRKIFRQLISEGEIKIKCK